MQKQSLRIPLGRHSRVLAALLLLSTVFFGFERTGAASGLKAPGRQTSKATGGDKVWLVVKVQERRLELVGDYSYRMNGSGQVNFKEGGRVVELPEGLTILVNDKKVETEQQVHEGESVRVTTSKGETLWEISLARSEEMSW
jgi:hypothetical protein